MPEIQQVVNFVESLAPTTLAEEWDNVGLLVNCGGPVSKILVALDITPTVVQEARQQGCTLIVAHHPVIFSPLRSIAQTDVVFQLVKAGISALCAHTNLDTASGGVNDVLAGLLGLQDIQPFEETGRIGTLQTPVPPAQFAAFCAKQLGAVVQFANAGALVQKVALVGGSGKQYLYKAPAAGAQCFVTGEGGHHEALDAIQLGVSLIAAGHYATEHPVVAVLAQKLQTRFADAQVLTSKQEADPLCFVHP